MRHNWHCDSDSAKYYLWVQFHIAPVETEQAFTES